MSTSNPPHITHTEWSTIAPAFMQQITAGPGVAPAKHMAEYAEKLRSFSQATTVVDMGCGPGQVTNAVLEAHAAQLPPSAKIIGADNNGQMLAQYSGRQKTEIAKGNSYWGRAETLELDIHDCAALEDGSVSHMLCGFVVFLIPNPGQAIAAMKRALAPGGVLAMSSLQSSDWAKLSTYPIKVRPDLAVPGPNNGCSSPEDVLKHLQEAGFTDIEVVPVESYMAFDDYDAACRFLLTKMPMTARAVAQMTNEEVLKTHELMMNDLKSWYPTLPAKMKGNVSIAYARK
ncbi:S-adenosyl-L-methionine-dependent methyltransferase [Xylariomycetidae sp. FL2044]|nr:S-adenosyl-L-methionine-dependent methyltransferase [Xylariomycetidae sp. FL2044]